MVDKELAAKSYYHGLLPREDIKEMLVDNGDWLLRLTEPSAPGKRDFVISIQTDKDANNGLKHFVITRKDDKFQLMDSRTFDSIVKLVEFYQKENIQSRSNAGVATNLVKAVTRQKWELEHDDIESTKKLGEGAFGEVHKGRLKKRRRNGKEKIVNVAIKLAKLDALTKEQIKDFMREARIMRNFDHPNVVKLYGVAAGQEPLMLVMELATDGALDSYLSKNELLPQSKRMEMTCQAAWGIEYLHSRNCMHRDVAARNCLYGGGNVKISDYGLSRLGDVYQMNPKNKVPIRWLSPETLKTYVYTKKSDVWSWGILVWEIFNNGIEPYPGMTSVEVIRFVKGGRRIDMSEKMDNKGVADMIEKHCLELIPEDRWSSAQVVKELEVLTNLKQRDDKDKERDAQKLALSCVQSCMVTTTTSPSSAMPDIVDFGSSVPNNDSDNRHTGTKTLTDPSYVNAPATPQSITSKSKTKRKKKKQLQYINS